MSQSRVLFALKMTLLAVVSTSFLYGTFTYTHLVAPDRPFEIVLLVLSSGTVAAYIIVERLFDEEFLSREESDLDGSFVSGLRQVLKVVGPAAYTAFHMTVVVISTVMLYAFS